MARPERHDADYFPFYSKDGRTLFLLQDRFGLEGIGFFTNVCRFLCETPDHHVCIQDDSDRMYFYAKIGIEEKKGEAMLDLMAKTEKIDPDLWDKKVIASEAFLESLAALYERRSNECITIEEIRKRYDETSRENMIDNEDLREQKPTSEEVSGDINPVNEDYRVHKPTCDGVSGDNNPQSKVKKSKVKKSKVKNIKNLTPKTASSEESSIFKRAQILMEEIHGDTYLNYKKEAPCLKRFIEQVSKKSKHDPWELIEAMIYQFAEMKQHDRTSKGYWRTMDFTPCKLLSHAENIYEQFKQRTKEEKLTSEDKELIKRLWGGG